MATEANQALIVIDVQAGFISEYTERCLPRIRELVSNKEFSAILATRFSNPIGSQFRRLIGWSRLSTPEDIALEPVVERYADIVVDKTTYGAGEILGEELRKRNISVVTLVGIDTDVCVLQNAASLFDQGFTVYVDVAGCATNGGREADAAAIPLLRRTIGTNQVIYHP